MTIRIKHVMAIALGLAMCTAAASAQDSGGEGEGEGEFYRRALEALEKAQEEGGEGQGRRDEPKAAAQPATPADRSAPPRATQPKRGPGLPGFSEVAPKPPVPPTVEQEQPRETTTPKPRVIVVEPRTRSASTPVTVRPQLARPPIPPPIARRPMPPPDGNYTIQPGDTFSSIAMELYGDESKWAAIAKANPLIDPIRLKVGQVIRLPDLGAQERERGEELEKVQRELSDPNATPQTVTVEPGDVLTGISQRVYGRASLWRIIFDANKDQLETPDDLKVGMKLKVPPKPARSGTPDAPQPPASEQQPQDGGQSDDESVLD